MMQSSIVNRLSSSLLTCPHCLSTFDSPHRRTYNTANIALRDVHISTSFAPSCAERLRSRLCRRVQIILLAYSRLGGLEGKALQGAIFGLLRFASEAGKT